MGDITRNLDDGARALFAERIGVHDVIDALPQQVAILDGQGDIVAVNASWLGFSAENGGDPHRTGIGRNYFDACRCAAGEDFDAATAVMQGLRDVIEGRKRAFSFEYPCRMPNETRWFIFNAMGGIGDFVGAIVVHLEVTASKRTELALRENKARLRIFTEMVPAGIAMFDQEMRYISASRRYAEELRIPLAGLIGRCHYDVFPEISERWRDIHRRCLAGAVERCEDDPFPRADGTIDWVSWEIRPWRQANGDIGGLVLANEVVTARKKAEEAMRRLAVEATLAEERERQSIAADLHDDLGQTLHIAQIKLRTLARSCVDEGSVALVAVIGDLIADASRMIRSVVSQLSPPALKDLGLVPALRLLATEMQRGYGLSVSVVDDREPKPLSPAQGALLYRAVRELLINVAKHAGADSARVLVSARDRRLRVVVEDEGVGMDDLQADIVSPKGFGLASMRERMTYLNGVMEVTSRPGNGTLVLLEMPFGEEPPQ